MRSYFVLRTDDVGLCKVFELLDAVFGSNANVFLGSDVSVDVADEFVVIVTRFAFDGERACKNVFLETLDCVKAVLFGEIVFACVKQFAFVGVKREIIFLAVFAYNILSVNSRGSNPAFFSSSGRTALGLDVMGADGGITRLTMGGGGSGKYIF